MTTDDARHSDDDDFAARLAEVDDAMASGRAIDGAAETDGMVGQRVQRAAACLEMLEELWSPPPANDAAAVDGDAAVNQLPFRIGRFTIQREIGRGGFGVVFLALDTVLGRQVALKVPRLEALASSDHRRRFLLEARAAGLLSHPNVVPVYEAGEIGPVCYIAAAYCDGTHLAAWLSNAKKLASPNRAARLVALLAEAVEHAHGRGILHRDIKPSNVLLEASGVPAEGAASVDLGNGCYTPKLTDFGLAKLLRSDGEEPNAAIVGTPAYMAPEQVEATTSEVGPAADIYALGAVLYELLTGKPPIGGVEDRTSLKRVLTEEPIRPRRLRSSIPADLEAICLKCLRKDAAARYASARELAADLRRYLAGESTQARPTTLPGKAARWMRRQPAVAALVSLLLIVLGGSMAVRAYYLAQMSSELDFANNWRTYAVTLGTKRAEAERREQETLRKYFQTGMQLAHEALTDSNIVQAEELLAEQSHVADESLRGFGWGYLWRLCHGEPITLDQRRDRITAVAFSADGALMAGGTFQGRIKLWTADRGEEREVVADCAARINCIEFLDAETLVAGDSDGVVTVWNIAGPSLRKTIDLSVASILGFARSVDGRRLAIASHAHVCIFDTATWTQTTAFALDGGGIQSIAMSDDGTLVAIGRTDAVIDLYDARGKLRSLVGHSAAVNAVDFSRDGAKLLSASDDRTLRIWDTGAGTLTATLTGHVNAVSSAQFAPNDDGVAISASVNGAVRIWEAATGTTRRVFKAHTGTIDCVRYSPDGARVATIGREDRSVKLWDRSAMASQERVSGMNAPVQCLAFSYDGALLATGGLGREIALWDPATGQGLGSLGGHADDITSLAFSRTGWLVSASQDGTARIWDMATRRERLALGAAGVAITAVAVAPDGNTVVTGRADGLLQWWEPQSGVEICRDAAHTGLISELQYSRDGSALVSAGHDGEILVWDSVTSEIRERITTSGGWVQALAVSNDARMVAAATSDDYAVRLYLFAPVRETIVMNDHTDAVLGLSFSPESGTLASASADATVRIWNLTTREVSLKLRGHAGPVNAVAFSHDGRTLASGGTTPNESGELYLWFGSDGR